VRIKWLIDPDGASVLAHKRSACGEFAMVDAQDAGNIAMSAIELEMVTRVSNCESHVIAAPDTRLDGGRLDGRAATGTTQQSDRTS